MVLGQYADNILNVLTEMRYSEVKVLVWMTLRSPYNDGRIIVNRRTVAKELKVSLYAVRNAMPVLEKWGFIEKAEISTHKRIQGEYRYGEYRVKIRYAIGPYTIQVPQMPLIQ